MSNKLNLVAGRTYYLKIDSISVCVKKFNTKKGEMCRHDVTCSDKNGNTEVYEYCIPEETPSGLYVGLMQYIKCLFASDKGAEIEPTEEPVSIHKTPSTQTISAAIINKPDTPKNQYTANISGSSMAFSMAYAKDILVAEKTALKTPITDEDIQRMIGWADTINGAIVDRISF